MLYVNFSIKCSKFVPVWSIIYFQPILAAISVTKSTVKVKLILDFYTWDIDLKGVKKVRSALKSLFLLVK